MRRFAGWLEKDISTRLVGRSRLRGRTQLGAACNTPSEAQAEPGAQQLPHGCAFGAARAPSSGPGNQPACAQMLSMLRIDPWLSLRQRPTLRVQAAGTSHVASPACSAAGLERTVKPRAGRRFPGGGRLVQDGHGVFCHQNVPQAA